MDNDNDKGQLALPKKIIRKHRNKNFQPMVFEYGDDGTRTGLAPTMFDKSGSKIVGLRGIKRCVST